MTLLILVAVAVLAGFGLFVLLVFVPVAGWYLWRMQDRIAALEKRIAELEGKPRR